MLILSNVYTLYRYMFFKLKNNWYNLILTNGLELQPIIVLMVDNLCTISVAFYSLFFFQFFLGTNCTTMN